MAVRRQRGTLCSTGSAFLALPASRQGFSPAERQQRLALIRALALEPDVLFLDEPTASLDPASVLTIEEVVRSAVRSGTKVIFVTHDLNQARRLGDEVVFLHRGRLLERSPAEQFFNAPGSEPAAAYIEGRIVL